MAKFQLYNPEQFISLVNLLSLRNGGQLQPSNQEEEEHEDDEICGDDSTVWGGKEDEFKQRFLDRFAEIMLRVKSRKHVCSVALRESRDQCLNGDVKISLFVARDVNFEHVDEKFRRRLEKLLAAIGASVYEEQNDISAVKQELWEELLRFYQPRLDFYADRLRDNLKAFKAAGSLDSIPLYTPQPQSDHSEQRTFWDESCVGPYSEATHDDYMKLAQKHILELDTILCTGDRATQRRLLAEHTYSIRRAKSLRILINSCPNFSAGHRLLSDILFLGHLMSCYYTLVEAALNIPGFAHLSIIFVKSPAPRNCPAALPPLANAMEFFGQTLNPTSVKKFISEKLDVISAERAFKQLQDTISRKHLPTHAELQLVFHIIRTVDIDTMNREVYPYIGCSKLSCFLCAAFLESFNHHGVTFTTRGSHGKIYTLWSIPDMDGLCEDMVAFLHAALIRMLNLLIREMTMPVMTAAHVAESPAGVTDYNPQPPFVRQYHRNPAAQREFDFLRAGAPENLIRNFGPVEVGARDAPRAFEHRKAPGLSGECRHCERETARKCSRCRGPWMCSERCENECHYGHTSECAMGRPDTADHLLWACRTLWLGYLDDDTRQDFGFTKCSSVYDVERLFGLYVGLTLSLGVESRELRKWQKEGTLTENIMAKYETIPENRHSECYRWFHKTFGVFNSRSGPPNLDLLKIARPYLKPADRGREFHQLVPVEKRNSFLLYGLLLNGYHPNPSLPLCNDLYFEFGFVTGRGLEGEEVLPGVYRSLISRCSFTEFWTAFQSNNLIGLMDEKGLGPERKKVLHFEDFMKIKRNYPRPSVWRLRHFVHSRDVDPPLSVFMDYGFFNCVTVGEVFSLKEVYQELLESPRVDPMELHAACIKGNLYNFARRHNPNLEQRFKTLMTNIYPLRNNTQWAVASPSFLLFLVLFFVSVSFTNLWSTLMFLVFYSPWILFTHLWGTLMFLVFHFPWILFMYLWGTLMFLVFSFISILFTWLWSTLKLLVALSFLSILL
ncbi:hypothetical protein BKA82DRAFT_4234318 [Pisolithus tinctorius]|nr:hypothetical protein BKA82DRAFT_4234318 [Pisolithus tinctorius]